MDKAVIPLHAFRAEECSVSFTRLRDRTGFPESTVGAAAESSSTLICVIRNHAAGRRLSVNDPQVEVVMDGRRASGSLIRRGDAVQSGRAEHCLVDTVARTGSSGGSSRPSSGRWCA